MTSIGSYKLEADPAALTGKQLHQKALVARLEGVIDYVFVAGISSIGEPFNDRYYLTERFHWNKKANTVVLNGGFVTSADYDETIDLNTCHVFDFTSHALSFYFRMIEQLRNG